MHLLWKLLQPLCSWSGYGPGWSLSASSGIQPRTLHSTGPFYLTFATFYRFSYRINQRFPKVRLLSATGSQEIRGYISVMVTLKFTYFFN
jgi:hypothetical protein